MEIALSAAVAAKARLAALGGKKRACLLMVLGALAALALPPVGWVPVMLLCLPGLIWAWDQATTVRAAFMACWFWCLGFYTAGFYWIANALLTDAAKFGWMIPFATLGLGGLVSVFPAAALTVGRFVKAEGPARMVWFAIFWTVGEWLRTFVLTGFPWNPMGSVWDAVLPVLQAGALFGVHGLSFMTALSIGLLAALPTLATGRTRTIAALVAVGLPLSLGLWGQVRLWRAAPAFVPGITLRMVQPALSQAEKWRPENRESVLRTMVTLSRSEGFQSVTHVIWPESAVPFDLSGDAAHRNQAALAAPLNGLLLAGAPRLNALESGGWQFWNSLIAIDSIGRVQGIYDKVHLVPFGEYVPLRGILPIPRVVSSMGDFSPGPGPRTLDLPGLPPVGPTVCYESIFPGQVVEKGAHRPKWMAIITNDGWFGNSAGPHQHFAAARMRAIEEGLPVARAANTGISGVIDGYGRVVAHLDLGRRGVVDAPLPEPVEGETPYGQWGDWSVLLLLALSSAIAAAFRKCNQSVDRA